MKRLITLAGLAAMPIAGRADIVSVGMNGAPFGWSSPWGGEDLRLGITQSGSFEDIRFSMVPFGYATTLAAMWGPTLPGVLEPGLRLPTDASLYEPAGFLASFWSSGYGDDVWSWGGEFLANVGAGDPLSEAVGIGPGYKGFMVDTPAGTCFGWVLIDNSGPDGPLESFRVLEYAYESSPGVAITVGERGAACSPTVAVEARVLRVDRGSSVRLDAHVSGRLLGMRWLRDGAEVAGDRAQGVHTPWLELSDVSVADAGEYSLEVTGECDQLRSEPIRIAVPGPCPPLHGSALAVSGVEGSNALVPGFGDAAGEGDMTIEFWQFAQRPAWQTPFNTTPVNEGSRFLFHGPFADGRVYWDFGTCNPDFGHCDHPGLGRVDYLPPEDICGSWQHFALVADRQAGTLSIYRNGVLEARREGVPRLSLAGSALAIGGGPSYHGMLAGMVDEFRVWNSARSAEEIRAFMRSTVPERSPGLAAYYRFDSASDGLIEDLSGQGLTAVLSPQATLQALTPCCPADFNGDGAADFFDYDDFVACFDSDSCPAAASADLNADGFVDFFDYDVFLAAFEAGC